MVIITNIIPKSNAKQPLNKTLLISVVGLFVMLGWATFRRTGSKYPGLGSWDWSNYNSLWFGLCTNYASFAKNMPMASRATSDEL